MMYPLTLGGGGVQVRHPCLGMASMSSVTGAVWVAVTGRGYIKSLVAALSNRSHYETATLWCNGKDS